MSQKSAEGLHRMGTTLLAHEKSEKGLIMVFLDTQKVEEADLNVQIVSTTNIFDLQESAIRYKAVDSQTPTWLSMYQIETPGVASSEAYDAVRAKASDKEKTILAAISGLSRGTYVDVGSFTHPDATADSLPCKYVLAVGLEPTPQEEDDLNKWYEEEHMDLLAKTPGWRQGRRYKLVEQRQTGTLADKPMSKYLAIHEFEENNFLQSPEFKHATSTEWRERVMSNMVRREARVLELYKGFTA